MFILQKNKEPFWKLSVLVPKSSYCITESLYLQGQDEKKVNGVNYEIEETWFLFQIASFNVLKI